MFNLIKSLILGLLIIVPLMAIYNHENDIPEAQSEFSVMLPGDGTPMLMVQNRVGDDTTPIIHQTWCQILPYKRYVGDDRVFCYVEVIDDWKVEEVRVVE